MSPALYTLWSRLRSNSSTFTATVVIEQMFQFYLLFNTVLSSSWAKGGSGQTGPQYLRDDMSSDADGRRLRVNCWLLLPRAYFKRNVSRCYLTGEPRLFVRGKESVV